MGTGLVGEVVQGPHVEIAPRRLGRAGLAGQAQLHVLPLVGQLPAGDAVGQLPGLVVVGDDVDEELALLVAHLDARRRHGADSDDALDAVRRVDGQALDHHACHGEPHQMELLVAQVVGERERVGSPLHLVVFARLVQGLAVAPEVRQDVGETLRIQIGKRRVPTFGAGQPVIVQEGLLGAVSVNSMSKYHGLLPRSRPGP